MVDVENITFAYHRQAPAVLEGVGFRLERGQCVAILGTNGAGKTTLLKCLDCLCPVQKGAVEVDGQDILQMGGRQRARQLAYVPQNGQTARMTVFDAVLLGRRPYIRWDATEEDRKVVNRILQRMGLEDYALRQVSELSGGEAQRVLLARALAQEPKFLLLDEPTSSLDPRAQHEVLLAVRQIARENQICVAIIIHDLNLAIRYCDKFLFLQGAQVYAYGGREIMTAENIQAVYNMRAQVIQHGGIPLVVPFPEGGLEVGA